MVYGSKHSGVGRNKRAWFLAAFAKMQKGSHKEIGEQPWSDVGVTGLCVKPRCHPAQESAAKDDLGLDAPVKADWRVHLGWALAIRGHYGECPLV